MTLTLGIWRQVAGGEESRTATSIKEQWLVGAGVRGGGGLRCASRPGAFGELAKTTCLFRDNCIWLLTGAFRGHRVIGQFRWGW